MKKLILIGAFAASVMTFARASADSVKTHEAILNISEAYVPGGFSSQTDAYVVVSGMFPNSCYRFNHAQVSDKSSQIHEVRSYATVSEAMCLMVLVPYQHEVRLGRLPAGEHTLRFINGDGTYFEKSLTVE